MGVLIRRKSWESLFSWSFLMSSLVTIGATLVAAYVVGGIFWKSGFSDEEYPGGSH